MTDLFDEKLDDEELKPDVLRLTAKELKDGISLDISFPDGKIFLVEKR